jgi:hypothetical protein
VVYEVYEVYDDRLLVLVIKLGHRRETYRSVAKPIASGLP